jgi:hypothetical protein
MLLYSLRIKLSFYKNLPKGKEKSLSNTDALLKRIIQNKNAYSLKLGHHRLFSAFLGHFILSKKFKWNI